MYLITARYLLIELYIYNFDKVPFLSNFETRTPSKMLTRDILKRFLQIIGKFLGHHFYQSLMRFLTISGNFNKIG